jgi:hypothetical protein
MASINVDGLNFDFPAGWQVSKYDEWAFYRNQFSRMRSGIKALDLVALDPQKTGWLIEVKDYRNNPRTKPSGLGEEVAHKVFDTLAALPPARINAADPAEKGLADDLLKTRRYRVILHLEQPAKHSTLRPRAINPVDVQQKLRQLIKPVDAHPCVVEKGRMGSLAWSVS